MGRTGLSGRARVIRCAITSRRVGVVSLSGFVPEGERLRREVQRPPLRRMPQRAQFSQTAACPRRARDLAREIQRGATGEAHGRPDTGGLCPTVGGQSHYEEIWTPKDPATESGERRMLGAGSIFVMKHDSQKPAFLCFPLASLARRHRDQAST